MELSVKQIYYFDIHHPMLFLGEECHCDLRKET